MARKQITKVTLPVGQVPAGRGWSILTGNERLNVWTRKSRARRVRCVPLERNPFYDNVQWRRS
jgi:hypothetical protein